MQVKKAGRPKKKNAVKPGQIKSDETRMLIVTTRQRAAKLRAYVKSQSTPHKRVTIKEVIGKLIDNLSAQTTAHERNEAKAFATRLKNKFPLTDQN